MCRVARGHSFIVSFVGRILKTNFYKPYKVHLLQELNEDYDRGLEFCEKILDKVDEDSNFITFALNGLASHHNFRYCSDEKPQWMRKEHTQIPQKINVIDNK